MSAVTKAIGLAKKLKHRYQDAIRARTPVYLSPVRRIERVSLPARVCAMTFDDGPCRLPANPAKDDKPLTPTLLEALEAYDARGTFDIVGDTSENYPDKPGKEGSASWGGVRFDHYPDFGKDADGGAVHCPELVQRILDGGHEITSHTYRHVLYGPKPLVYGGRHPFDSLDEVVDDLKKLDSLMRSQYGYEIRLSRPPHYVDKTRDGFTSYDAHAALGYQYMAASFDGAGWLPLASYEAEVEAMITPMERVLAENPDSLCGQIIFQKDGYNMARRSPVADALPKQLALLRKYGYRVVTVSELLGLCPFSDLSPQSPLFAPAKALLDTGWCICFRDNTVRPDAVLSRAEACMFAFGWKTAERRVELVRMKTNVCRDVSYRHPYSAAIELALERGCLSQQAGNFRPDDPITAAEFDSFCQGCLHQSVSPAQEPITHGMAIELLAALAQRETI